MAVGERRVGISLPPSAPSQGLSYRRGQIDCDTGRSNAHVPATGPVNALAVEDGGIAAELGR